MIVAAVSVVAGATVAGVFSSQDEIEGNTIATGSVNLVVHNFSENKPINTSLLVPGEWTPWGRAEAYNTGNVPVQVYMYVDNVEGVVCGKTNLELRTGWAGGDEKVREIYNGPLMDLVGPENREEITGNPPFDQLNPNWSQVVWQRAQLDDSADSGDQGEVCSWREVFVAENVAP